MDDDDVEYPPEAYSDPRLMELLENFRAMPEDRREKFLKFAQRVSKLPVEVQKSLTPDTLRQMLENDSDFPYN